MTHADVIGYLRYHPINMNVIKGIFFSDLLFKQLNGWIIESLRIEFHSNLFGVNGSQTVRRTFDGRHYELNIDEKCGKTIL